MTDLLSRLTDRIESLPAPLRPAATGMAMVLGFMWMRGILYLGPIVVVVVLLKSDNPVSDLACGAGVVALAVLAGGAGGLAYGTLGIPARRVPKIGAHLAGIVSIAPYMLFVYVINQARDHEPLLGRPGVEDIAIYTAMTLFFGALLGHSMFGPDAKGPGESEARDA
jgi:hypothetical protein